VHRSSGRWPRPCSYQDPAHNAITITLADNFPTSDLNAVEQFLSTTNGTSTPETFTPVTGVGGQAVWYSFSYAAMGGGNQAVCGMVATQGIPCVDRFEHSEMCSSWSMDPIALRTSALDKPTIQCFT
jgi:hypothetical protein